VVRLEDFPCFLRELFDLHLELDVKREVVQHFIDTADWVTNGTRTIDPLSFWNTQKYVITYICHFLISGHPLGLLVRILHPEAYRSLLDIQKLTDSWEAVMIPFQTTSGSEIYSFPLLEVCYAVLQRHFSLSTQYESLSYGAKEQLDSVSSQCSSQRLTCEAVDRLLAQMELSTGIPGGVDLHRHSCAFDVDNAIGSIMTQYPDLDAIEREYDPEYRSPFDKRPNMRNSYCMACQGFCTGHCDNPLPAN
jgi:hypothetical protein